MLLLFLSACFQIEEKEWNDWAKNHQSTANFIETVVISPHTEVYNDSNLACAATLSSDDLLLELSYVWQQNGSKIGEGPSIDLTEANILPLQTISCVATAVDTNGATDSQKTTIEIQNRQPSISTPLISNSAPEVLASIGCEAIVTDQDGENLTPTYQWIVEESVIGEANSLVLNPDIVSVGTVVECQVSVTDNYGSEARNTSSVTVTNSKPTIVTPEITPNTDIHIDSLLSCTTTGEDINDGVLTPNYVWSSDGRELGVGASLQLNDTLVEIGDSVVCTATVTDQENVSESDYATVMVVNSAPAFSDIVIHPIATAPTDTELTCTAIVSDLEDGALIPSYSWSNGAIQLTTGANYTISSIETNVGDTITCTATAIDSDLSSSSTTASIIVVNTNPVVSNTTITPSTIIYNDANLSCSATVFDPDEIVNISYAWKKNGTLLSTGSSLNLANYSINPEDSITCMASASDSQGGNGSQSTSIEIGNRSPSISTPILSNQAPEASALVSCSSFASDPDGESVTPSYRWFIDNLNIGTGASFSLNPNIAPVGSSLKCEATATDSYGLSTTELSSSVAIINTNPSISQPTISPSTTITTSSLLSCSALGSDLNDGSITPSYQWTNGGSVLGNAPSLQLNNTIVSVGDLITCTATVNDNHGGTISASNAVTVSGSAPYFTIPASIVPNGSAYTGTELSCTAEGVDENEGALPPSYSWSNGATQLTTGANYIISSTETNVGDTITCTATVSNSSSISTSSSVSIVVENTIPVISSVQISNSTGFFYNDETVNCTALVEDPDETPTLSYIWSSGGVELAFTQSFDLSTSALIPSDPLTCTVLASDSSWVIVQQSTTELIDNRAPSSPLISITGSEDSDDLVCTASGSIDPDGMQVYYSYLWTSSNGASISGATVLESETSALEAWTCTATATDGEDSSTANSSVIIAASVPAGCSLTICDSNLDLGGGQGIDFVSIPSGTNTYRGYSLTQSFDMMTTETTQGMFYQVMGYQAYDGESTTQYQTNYSYGVGDNYAAYYISWFMAADFANHVTQLHNTNHGTSFSECYSCSNVGTTNVSCTLAMNPYQCDGYRMPTEAEWEYAALAGQFGFWTPDGGGVYSDSLDCSGNATIQNSGNTPLISQYAWYCGNNNINGFPFGAKEVAQLLPNGWGLYDMHGNLWEWVNDDNSCSFPLNTSDPFCAGSSNYSRIRRGGSWEEVPQSLINIGTNSNRSRNSSPEASRIAPDRGVRLIRVH